jgi:hypothetical protein
MTPDRSSLLAGMYKASVKAKAAYRKLHPGQCKMFSLGHGCKCFLCVMDEYIYDQTFKQPEEHEGESKL